MTGATHKHNAAGCRRRSSHDSPRARTGNHRTGSGVGKSTIANEAAWLLRQADMPHALVDLDRIEQSWPVPADDPGNERVSHGNLACESDGCTVHTSVNDITDSIATWNDNPRSFTWTKTADETLNSLADYLAKVGTGRRIDEQS